MQFGYNVLNQYLNRLCYLNYTHIYATKWSTDVYIIKEIISLWQWAEYRYKKTTRGGALI